MSWLEGSGRVGVWWSTVLEVIRSGLGELGGLGALANYRQQPYFGILASMFADVFLSDIFLQDKSIKPPFHASAEE